MRHAVVKHNGKEYDIRVKRSIFNPVITVDGKPCYDIKFWNATDVLSAIVPETDEKTVVLVYYRKIYLIDIQSDMDVNEQISQLLKSSPRVFRTLLYVGLLIAEILFMAVLMEREMSLIHVGVPPFILDCCLTIRYVFFFDLLMPSNKKMLSYKLASLVGVLLGLLYMLAVLI